jgi:hypothetical protein
MAIEGFVNNTTATSDQAAEESSLNGAGRTQSAEGTSTQQAGEDVTGAETRYNGQEGGDLDAKTDEAISKIEEVQILLDEVIVSLGGGEEAPAGGSTEPATAKSEAPLAQTEIKDTAAETPDLKSFTDDIGGLLDQISAMIEGEEAAAAPSDEAGATGSSGPAQTAAQNDTAESAAEASSASDLQILLEDLSTSLDQVSELIMDEAGGVKSADTAPAAASDTDSNATASASAEVNITIGQGENGDILVSTQPADEASEGAKSDDSASDGNSAGAGGRLLSGIEKLVDQSGILEMLFDFLPASSDSAENKSGTTSILGGLFVKNEENGEISGPCRQLNPDLPEGYCPLTLDTDKDGMVEATAGMGVDISGNGMADGAATGGDKMLAMSDITGDGQIGGTEVFGNKTVDPFSGEALNAENGFEALQMVAASAEEKTGMECIDDNGVVNLQNLKQALESEGIGLGMISGNNTTHLESLGDAASIDTANYIEQQDTGDVRHNQLGSYQDTSGDTHKVDDIWF